MLLGWLFLFGMGEALAQRYVVVDRYTFKRYKYVAGDEITLKLKDVKKGRFTDRIMVVGDSAFILSSLQRNVRLDEVQTVYVSNAAPRVLNKGFALLGGGFLIAWAVHPNVAEAAYQRSDAAVMGIGFATLSAAMLPFYWKRFHVARKNAQIRTVNIAFGLVRPTEIGLKARF